jgi:hypothetical protein
MFLNQIVANQIKTAQYFKVLVAFAKKLQAKNKVFPGKWAHGPSINQKINQRYTNEI